MAASRKDAVIPFMQQDTAQRISHYLKLLDELIGFRSPEPDRPLFLEINEILERMQLLPNEKVLMCAECYVAREHCREETRYWCGLMFLTDERIFLFVDSHGKKTYRSFHSVFDLRSIVGMRGDRGDLEFYLVGRKKDSAIKLSGIHPYPRADGQLNIDDAISLIKWARFNKRNRISGYSPISSFDQLNSRFRERGLEFGSMKCMACGLFSDFPQSGKKKNCPYCDYQNDISEVAEKMRAMM